MLQERACSLLYGAQRLQAHYILSLQTLLPLYHGVFNLLPFGQRAVAFTTNSTVVDKYIGTTFTLNEAVALGVVEPLHAAGLASCHQSILRLFIISRLTETKP
ncbi:hypothetical protein EMIT0196P_90349 [Pseudomonas chlororaphis]